MRLRFIGITCLTLLGLLGSAVPALAVFGDYYLIESPTPYSLKVNRWEAGVHTFADGPWVAELHAGAAPGLTLGIDAVENDGGGLEFKYQLLPGREGSPALALGIADIGRDQVSPYLVIGEKIPGSKDVRWHLGIGGGRFDGLFAGIDAGLNQGHGGLPVELTAELVNSNLNIGFSLGIAPGWRLEIASAEDDLLAGVSYRSSF